VTIIRQRKRQFIIHWDGKLLPNLTGKGLVDRLPIIASVNDRKQLLGVPALNSGTGREQANAVIPYTCRLVFR